MKYKFLSSLTLLLAIVVTLPAHSSKEVNIEEVRTKYFEMKPEAIGLSEDNFSHPVWGVIMETGFTDGYYTLVTLADGTASVHFSEGGGILGGGAHESVRQLAGRYLLGAQYFVTKATKADSFPVPADGEVTFSFLTFDGVKQISGPEMKLGVGDHEYSNLFAAAQEMMDELSKLVK